MERSRKSFSAAERAEWIARATAFDMRDVLQRYSQETGLSDDVIREHERELKRFLVVCALNEGGKPIGMAGPVDKLWHTFVLFTRQYAAFCEQVAGHFIHHVPAVPGRGRTVTGGYARFRASYADVFGASPPTSVWPDVVAAVSTSAGPSRCFDCFDCFGPDPVPCDNREPDDCAGTDTDDDDDEDRDDEDRDDEDRDDDSDVDKP